MHPSPHLASHLDQQYQEQQLSTHPLYLTLKSHIVTLYSFKVSPGGITGADEQQGSQGAIWALAPVESPQKSYWFTLLLLLCSLRTSLLSSASWCLSWPVCTSWRGGSQHPELWLKEYKAVPTVCNWTAVSFLRISSCTKAFNMTGWSQHHCRRPYAVVTTTGPPTFAALSRT